MQKHLFYQIFVSPGKENCTQRVYTTKYLLFWNQFLHLTRELPNFGTSFLGSQLSGTSEVSSWGIMCPQKVKMPNIWVRVENARPSCFQICGSVSNFGANYVTRQRLNRFIYH